MAYPAVERPRRLRQPSQDPQCAVEGYERRSEYDGPVQVGPQHQHGERQVDPAG
jgi:hypothetical protein